MNIIIFVGLKLFQDRAPVLRELDRDYFSINKSNLLGFRDVIKFEYGGEIKKIFGPIPLTHGNGIDMVELNAESAERVLSANPDLARSLVSAADNGGLAYADKFKPIQVITWFFNHGDWGHLFMNMLGLFFFGPFVEQKLGSERFFKFYMFCGILGGLLLAFLDPGIPITLGASGALFGIMTAFVIINPKGKIYLYFAIPVPALLLVGGWGIFSLVMVLMDVFGVERAADNVSHFGHLTGMISAILFFYLEKKIPFLQ